MGTKEKFVEKIKSEIEQGYQHDEMWGPTLRATGRHWRVLSKAVT